MYYNPKQCNVAIKALVAVVDLISQPWCDVEVAVRLAEALVAVVVVVGKSMWQLLGTTTDGIRMPDRLVVSAAG